MRPSAGGRTQNRRFPFFSDARFLGSPYPPPGRRRGRTHRDLGRRRSLPRGRPGRAAGCALRFAAAAPVSAAPASAAPGAPAPFAAPIPALTPVATPAPEPTAAPTPRRRGHSDEPPDMPSAGPTSPAFATLDGTWEVQLQFIDRTEYSHFTLKQSGQTISGTWNVDKDAYPLEGTYDGRQFKFTVKEPATTLQLSGYVETASDMVGIIVHEKGENYGLHGIAPDPDQADLRPPQAFIARSRRGCATRAVNAPSGRSHPYGERRTPCEITSSASARARCTPARPPILRPAPARCRSISPRVSSSIRPNTRRNSSRCAPTATSTAASAIRPSPPSKSGSHRSKAGSERSRRRAASRRN